MAVPSQASQAPLVFPFSLPLVSEGLLFNSLFELRFQNPSLAPKTAGNLQVLRPEHNGAMMCLCSKSFYCPLECFLATSENLFITLLLIYTEEPPFCNCLRNAEPFLHLCIKDFNQDAMVCNQKV